jgi:hypothetical protein
MDGEKMELGSALLFHWLAMVVGITCVHLFLKRFEFTHSSPSWSSTLLFPCLLFHFALGLVPSFHLGWLLQEPIACSLLAVWVVLCVPFCRAEKAVEARWVCAWGLALAAPVTVYSDLDLLQIQLQQSDTLAGFLPAWGIFFHPIAFVISMGCLVQWSALNRFQLSVRHPEGLVTALLLSIQVAVFLGGWQIPFLSDSYLKTHPSLNGWAVSALQWGVFHFKVLGLALLLPRLRSPLLALRTPWEFSTAAALTLLLTWGATMKGWVW